MPFCIRVKRLSLEININHLASASKDFCKGAFTEPELVEGAVIELAAFETHWETQVIAVLKTQSEHFAGAEAHILEGGFNEFGITQVAFLEPAVNETAAW